MASVSLSEHKSALNGHGFYAPAEAARIARIPHNAVHTWRRQGIIIPSISWTDEEGHEELGYSFNSVVYLRLLRMLRDTSIPLEKSVHVVYELSNRFGPPSPKWEQARIFTDRRDVYVYAKDEWETTVATRGGQKLADVLFGEEFIQFRNRVDALLVPKRYQRHVEIDPCVRNGLPVIRNTSIPTALIHSLRSQGQAYVKIQYNYPLLTLAQVQGADAFETFLDAEALAA